MISVVRGIDGDHRGALADLERLWPMVRLASYEHPALRYDYLNSLAVEMAETGRIAEAKHAIGIALRSPFADRYPNWRATQDEIADKERLVSYRPRIFSLAGPVLLAAGPVAQEGLPEPLKPDSRVDREFAIEASSPRAATPAIDPRIEPPTSAPYGGDPWCCPREPRIP